MKVMNVHFSKHEGSSQLNKRRIFLPTGLKWMLEGKDNRFLDIVFPFGFGNANTWLGLQYDVYLTNIHILYTSMFNQLLSKN